jgi:hypothetical protein
MINNQVLKVKDHPTLYRDPNSKAILVVDHDARKNYLNQRAIAQRNNDATEALKGEVAGLRDELNDIKNMLSLISNKLNSDK